MNGSLTGEWEWDQPKANVNFVTGNFRSTGTGTFTGMYLGDRSKGTLTWRETWTGNVFTGAAWGVFDVTGGDGDPTFRCSSGRLVTPGYIALVATSYGGYSGTWLHGCPTKR